MEAMISAGEHKHAICDVVLAVVKHSPGMYTITLACEILQFMYQISWWAHLPF